jgi:tRNA threonylcarbamoyl adenosine modification protein (Sua5/YciO/YrdC/YwlC family)
MSRRYDCADPDERLAGLDRATGSIRRGELVVLPTDTVYGIGADAFTSPAIEALLAAKGRGRDMPVPVLVGSTATLPGIATGLGDDGRALVEAFWPGALTIVCFHQPSLRWDLGDTRGTVAVRMPLHPVALELLNATGPMAVSSANKSSSPPATTCDEAYEQLGDQVVVYLDGGTCTDPVPSTIVDVTGDVARVLRAGAISIETLREVVPGLT